MVRSDDTRGAPWRALAAATLAAFAGGCDSGADEHALSAGTGGACHDYVTPDGFTCCCGKSFCTRDPNGCALADAGGVGGAAESGTGCVTALPPDDVGPDATANVTIVLTDGSKIELDNRCPQIPFVVNYGTRAEFEFAYAGCCLPTGRCGAATLAGVDTDGRLRAIPLSTPGPACTCASYDELASTPGVKLPAQAPCGH